MKTILTLILSMAAGLALVAQTPPAPGAPGSVTNAPGAKGTNAPVVVPRRTVPGTSTFPAFPQAVTPGTNVVATNAAPSVGAPQFPGLPGTPKAAPGGNAVPVPTPVPGVVPAAPGGATPPAAGQVPPLGPGQTGGLGTAKGAAGTNSASLLKFNNTPLDQVLDYYGQLVGKIVIRHPGLNASQTVKLITPISISQEEAIQAIEHVLSMMDITVVPVGDKFVSVSPTPSALKEGGKFYDGAVAELVEAGTFTQKVLNLTNVKPSELVPILQPFAKITGGLLPVDATMVLVIRDYAPNVKRMVEIIKKIDTDVPLEEKMLVIPIKYALAADIASLMGSLTSGGVVGGTGTPSSGRGRSLGTTGMPGVGSNIPGQPGYNPNQPGGAQGFNTGIPGQTPGQPGGASSFQNRLNSIINRASAGAAGSGTPLLGAAKIIPYERSNAILAIGTASELNQVTNLVALLDIVQPQVLIESIIMEVTLDQTQNLGVSASQAPKKVGGIAQMFGGSSTVPFGSPLLSAATNLSSSLPSGFSYYALGNSWEAAVNAIASDSTVNVLSRPRIQTSHAETATLFVGDTVPYINGTISDINGGTRSSYQQTSIGISLSVLPLINADGLVVMDINQNIEQLGAPQKIDNNDVPTTTKRQAQAKVAVRDGETIILGGFISTQKTKSKSGVPYLKDIPYFGALFRSQSDVSKRVELIVLMRPTVLRLPEEAAIMAGKERAKLPGVRAAEKQILDDDAIRMKAYENSLKGGKPEPKLEDK